MLNLDIDYRFFAIKLKPNKYANQLICIFEFYTKGQCCGFNLIPNVLFYND